MKEQMGRRPRSRRGRTGRVCCDWPGHSSFFIPGVYYCQPPTPPLLLLSCMPSPPCCLMSMMSSHISTDRILQKYIVPMDKNANANRDERGSKHHTHFITPLKHLLVFCTQRVLQLLNDCSSVWEQTGNVKEHEELCWIYFTLVWFPFTTGFAGVGYRNIVLLQYFCQMPTFRPLNENGLNHYVIHEYINKDQ